MAGRHPTGSRRLDVGDPAIIQGEAESEGRRQWTRRAPIDPPVAATMMIGVTRFVPFEVAREAVASRPQEGWRVAEGARAFRSIFET
jgi:hypothetical protein